MMYIIKFFILFSRAIISRKYKRCLFLYAFSGFKLTFSIYAIIIHILLFLDFGIPKAINYLGGACVCVISVIFIFVLSMGTHTHIFNSVPYFSSILQNSGKKLGWD